MSAPPDDRSCSVHARAKLNLSLRVLAREESGYHQIETLFCALELADEIGISLTDRGIELDVMAAADVPGSAGDPGPVEANLAVRAARAFFAAVPGAGGARMRLVKRIPIGAGLGGGSSDAASVLLALNRLHGEPLTTDELRVLGGSLGSDVPFFITRAALALAWGRGDRMLPLQPLPSVPVLLAVPPERMATADAYAELARRRTGGVAAPGVVHAPGSWSDIAAHAHNDFEDAVFARHPRLRSVRAVLQESGARIARMTGSGTVVFGVFDDLAAAQRAASGLVREHPDVIPVLTRTAESVQSE